MRLEPITPRNYEDALKLSVREDQRDLVSSVEKSLAEAYVWGEHAWPRLIYDGDRMVGFLMAFVDLPWKDPDDTDRRCGLWRLNIAADEQGKGYGRFAVEAACAELRSRGNTRFYVTYVPRDGGPEPFYRRLGFVPTGELSGGETVAVRTL
ncbi:GNAT family N-acetyltransferase [Catenuloplanes atrovinosus]|uniref:Diamine N-acetyltransferase n=1 Tax=Catenuloplanes atrovinosus TaxID=137266 RepID=A0AAE4CAZ1_9ACTN|nr:GNAT family N-acetyltransferase [Catenuloplanes atrovinosus]MDR7275085.1 diamine N-acetyltransferase [Catenuloplanes atrovinosus]